MSMRLRLMGWGVLALGASLYGFGCGPTSAAEDVTSEKKPDSQFCGGIAAIQCPEGFICVDDPRDNCDPNQGGADCGGICKQAKQHECTGSEPGLKYASNDTAQCPHLPFTCAKDTTPFANGCGCGCREGNSCDYDDPNRTYFSTDPNECAVIRFLCIQGTVPFSDKCGCGCEKAP